MKKIIVIVLSIVFIFGFVACGSSSAPSQDIGIEAPIGEIPEDSGNTTVGTSDITVTEQVIFNQDGIKVTVTGFTMSEGFFSFGPSLNLLIENDSSDNITVQARDSSINNIMVDTIMSSDVAAGKKANTDVTFMSSYFDKAGITTVLDIGFRLHIFDAETWDTIVDSDLINLKTSADPSYVQPIDDSGFVALDQDGLRIVIKELDDMNSFWGADIFVFIENNTGQDIIVQARNTSINGFMIEPMFSADVLKDKVAFSELTFFDSDLEANGIETIETLELSFHIFNAQTWDTIFDSDPITVMFS